MSAKDKNQSEKREESSKSEFIQRFKDRPFLFTGTVLILVIVIIAFVFVPAIVPNAQHGTELVFGYYNKTPIKYVPGNFFHQVQSHLSRNERLSQDDPSYFSRLAQIWREAFTETVIQLGMLDEMKQAGYTAPEAVVDRAVASLDFLQENGRFSAARYRAMDNNDRMNLWRQTQENVAVQMYISDLENIKTSSSEAPFIAAMNSPRRSFDAAFFSISSYPDSEIHSYAEANPDLFKNTRLSRITVYSSEREARQIHNSVVNEVSTFEEIARTNSQDMYADRGGDMGILMAFELIYEISNEQDRNRVINLARGEVSDLIRISSGWAFFRANETAYQADLNDQSQLWKIRNYVMDNERGRAEDWCLAEAEKFIVLAEQRSFNEAISAGNVTRRSFGPMPLNYGNALPFGSLASAGIQELAAASTNQFFWRLAFSTPLNTPSRPLVIGDNIVVLMPVEETGSDEDDDFAGMFDSYWSYLMNTNITSSIRNKFLTSDKLENNFERTFWGLWNF